MGEDVELACYLFQAYFHQDCLVDDPDWESIVQRFKREESQDTAQLTREALLKMLERLNDLDLEYFLFGPSCLSFYDPRPEGLTPRAWIEEIVHLLAGGSSRTSDRAEVSRARRRAVSIARAVLSGEKDLLLAARELASFRFKVGVPENDPDFLCFVAIDSETDALPLGSERSHWSPEALRRKDIEITRCREWAAEFGRTALENIVRRFGSVE